MFSNERSDLKYNVAFTSNGLVGVQGVAEGVPCFAETQIRIELAGFGATSAISVEVRLRSSLVWTTLGTLLVNAGTILDVSTYDYIRYNIITVDGLGTVIASGFFIKPSSGGGGGAVTSVNTKIGAVVLVKADIGLSNVDNTSDINKPISTAQGVAIGLKENTVIATTSADYYRGDKTFQTLNKTTVGLSNVDNTSDANKPVSTAQGTAIGLKENTINAATSADYYRGDKTFQTLNKAAVGLSNVDNTSDINKPVSTAQALYFNYGKDIALTSLLNF